VIQVLSQLLLLLLLLLLLHSTDADIVAAAGRILHRHTMYRLGGDRG
jgi:hypothetical protein